MSGFQILHFPHLTKLKISLNLQLNLHRYLTVRKILYEEMHMSARSYHKVLKMARTIADLEDRDEILERDLMMASGFRLPDGIVGNSRTESAGSSHRVSAAMLSGKHTAINSDDGGGAVRMHPRRGRN